MLGSLVILVDVFLKGFSLRGLTALSFGLGTEQRTFGEHWEEPRGSGRNRDLGV